MTFFTFDGGSDYPGRFPQPMQTWDGKTVDSAGAFLISELERLDPVLHMPLAAVTWSRDIDMREDVTIADEAASFTNSTFASPGGITPTGVHWSGRSATAIAGISVDISKTAQPLLLWDMELKYSIPELESAIRLGRPIDQQKFEGLNLAHQMDIDNVVYAGDSTVGITGLFNSTAVTANTASATGTGGATTFATKTPANILADVNTLLTNVWAAAGYAVIPDRILLPPAQYGALVTQPANIASNVSILKYLEENNIAAQRGMPLEILPVKWAIGMGSGGTPQTLGTVDRMIAYSKDPMRLRYPMTPLQKTALQYSGIFHTTTYYCRLGQVEMVYPETMGFLDGV